MMKRLMILILTVALLAAACDSQGMPAIPTSTANTPTPAADTPTPEPTIAATATPEAPVEMVHFTTDDHVTLAGTLFGQGEMAVILAHQGTTGTDQQSWHPFAQLIAARGFTALTFGPDSPGGPETAQRAGPV